MFVRKVKEKLDRTSLPRRVQNGQTLCPYDKIVSS